MYFRSADGTFRNLETGHAFGVRKTGNDQTGWVWEVYSHASQSRSVVLETGYASAEEAQAALDLFAEENEFKVVSIQPPYNREDESFKEDNSVVQA